MAELTEIWKPLSVGPTDFKHRIMIAPHGQCYAENHRPSDRTVAYFRERAMGGVALQTIESTSASRYLSGAQPGGATSGWRMSAWEKDHIPPFALLADTVHEYGCKLFLELSTGRVNDVGRAWIDKWHPVWGPSRVPSPIMNEIPMTMEQAKIDELVSDYGTSAKNMLDAGLDGVEIHAAHGYLPMQYLSPIFNKRTDQYGGSAHNRARLTLEIGEKVRERVGTAISVGMRLSVDEYMGDAGIVPDLAEEYLEIFAASGLFDYFSISCGSWYSIHYTIPPMGTVDEAFLLPYGQRAKKIVGDRGKVFLSGRIRDLDTAERVVREGAADMVAMVRAHIADPYIVRKAQEGRSEEIIRCTGANECVAAPAKGGQVSCVMNPASGRERQWGNGTMQITPARKRVVVVGAGPAGMKVAGVAAKARPPSRDIGEGALPRRPSRPRKENSKEGRLADGHRQPGADPGGGWSRDQSRRRGNHRAPCRRRARRDCLRHRPDVGLHGLFVQQAGAGKHSGRRTGQCDWHRNCRQDGGTRPGGTRVKHPDTR